jgi:hypothetical protein
MVVSGGREPPGQTCEEHMAKLHWTQRKHAAHVSTRYFSGGWEFDTAAEARDYVSQQFAQYRHHDFRHTPFGFHVASNGVETRGYISETAAHVTTRTYTSGATMRDRMVTAIGLTDCQWIIPGSAY